MTAKEKIRCALLDILGEKDIRDITVTELIQRAGVSRSAYYYYFYRPESILDGMTRDFMKQYTAIIRIPGRAAREADSALRLARHFYENRTLVTRLFFSSRHDRFVSELIQTYASALEGCDIYTQPGSVGPPEKVEDRNLISLYAFSTGYTFIGRMEWWARCSFSVSPEEILDYGRQIQRMTHTSFVSRLPAP